MSSCLSSAGLRDLSVFTASQKTASAFVVAESADSGSKVDGEGGMRMVNGLPDELVSNDSEDGSAGGGLGGDSFWM